MNKVSENRLGGIALVTGTLLFLISVFFEYRIGWIALDGGPMDSYSFVRANWEQLSAIWFWQMLSSVLVLLAYILFLKQSKGIRSAVWALLVIGGIMTSAAFLLTLGSYGPALEVYDLYPELFETIRGGIRVLYDNIMIGPLLFLFIFCLDTFGKNSFINKKWGIASLALFAVSLLIGLATGVSLKVLGLTYFLLPLVYGYWAINKKGASGDSGQ